MSDNFLQHINCPVCSGNDKAKLFSILHNKSQVLQILGINDKNILADVVQCNICAHKYMTPVIQEELMNEYYSVLNSEFYNATNDKLTNLNEKEYYNYSNIIKGYKSRGKVLEIGCGKGFLLKTLAEQGFDCSGIEPSPKAYEFAKNVLKLNVENSFLTGSSFYKEKFDVIILIDVAEHILNMQVFMEEVNTVLKEGGIIFIGTGNIESFNAKFAAANWAYFVSWEHVSFFNKKSMRYLLEKNRFNNINITETSLQHKPMVNMLEFAKNVFKKLMNPFLRNKYYHGITYDHFIVTATKQSTPHS